MRQAFWALAIGALVLSAFGSVLFAIHKLRVRRALWDHEDPELAREVHSLRERRGF